MLLFYWPLFFYTEAKNEKHEFFFVKKKKRDVTSYKIYFGCTSTKPNQMPDITCK